MTIIRYKGLTKMSIKDKALKWWIEKTKKDEYIASFNELPPQRQRELLVKDKFLHPLTKGYWILKKPEDDIEEVLPLLYWQIVGKILMRSGEWSIKGKSALSILSGDQTSQKHLSIRTKMKSNRKISLPLEFDISLMYDPNFDSRLIKKVEIAGRNIPVDVPEKVLIDASKLKPDAAIKSFIAGTDFDLRTLEAIYAKSPKPIIFKRLVATCKDTGRADLVLGLEKIIKTHTHYHVGKRTSVEPEATTRKEKIKSPWVIRQESQIQDFEEILNKHLTKRIKEIKRHSLDKLLIQAKDHKKYDTYHSTTLEGYKVTPEEVEALLSGILPKEKEAQGTDYVEEIKNRMAILGYSEAFDFVIRKIQEDFNKPEVSEDLVKDVYYHLFKPSADAGITDYLSLVSYRTTPAFIRGTSYVPPSYEKLQDLMASYATSIYKVGDPIIKAILAHYFFVTIHPYTDGNGRTARLLMNYLLLAAGYPWITIRVDQRVEYFEALKKGQLNSNILPFGTFIIEMLEEFKVV